MKKLKNMIIKTKVKWIMLILFLDIFIAYFIYYY